MEQRKIAAWIYVILLVAAAFALGYFAGAGQTGPEVQITVGAAPELSAVPEQTLEAQTQAQPAAPETPVDLNQADQAALETLPGIGPELAGRIVAYRQSVGAFVSVEQIMDVEGIGEKRFEEIKDLITVGGGS